MSARKSLRWQFDEPVRLLRYKGLATVCEESRCPNRYECSSLGIATFMIGGPVCTRSCAFCHIATGRGEQLTPAMMMRESDAIMQAATAQNLRYVVVTAVARDDDEAGLAAHFAAITRRLAENGIEAELLIPDFHNRAEHLRVIGESRPLVVAQNIETVERLTRRIRPQAGYQRTLDVISRFREEFPHIIRKSGFMAGLGESMDEIRELLDDLAGAGVEIVTVGQYLQPSAAQAPVSRILNEDEFLQIGREIAERGFLAYEAGAFVRSSYMAEHTMARVREEARHRNV